MVRMGSEFRNRHKQYYSKMRPEQNRGRLVTPGMQYLVHLLRGGYLGGEWRDGHGRRVLDVGCGSGFNSVSLAMMGWQVSACEITEDIAQHSRESIRSFGHEIPVDVGENEDLPYPDKTFDFLLSLNVIHYVQSSAAAKTTVEEYARVLRPGGRVFLSTNHPQNWILKSSEQLGGNMVRVHWPGDYRDGQSLFLFQDENELREYFQPHFDDILTGMNRFDFFTRILKNWILSGLKR